MWIFTSILVKFEKVLDPNFMQHFTISLGEEQSSAKKKKALSKMTYSKNASILLEEKFCMTSGSLNFPSPLGSNEYITESLSESICSAWNDLYSLPLSRPNAGSRLSSDGARWNRSKSDLESCFIRLHTSGWVQILSVCRNSSDFCPNHERFPQQKDALVPFSQVCSRACEIDFWGLYACPP